MLSSRTDLILRRCLDSLIHVLTSVSSLAWLAWEGHGQYDMISLCKSDCIGYILFFFVSSMLCFFQFKCPTTRGWCSFMNRLCALLHRSYCCCGSNGIHTGRTARSKSTIPSPAFDRKSWKSWKSWMGGVISKLLRSGYLLTKMCWVGRNIMRWFQREGPFSLIDLSSRRRTTDSKITDHQSSRVWFHSVHLKSTSLLHTCNQTILHII